MRTLMAAFGLVSAALAAQAPCTEAPPAGFKTFDEVAWEGPWVVDARKSAPLPSFTSFDAPIPVRLDDGSRGTVRVTTHPCPKGEQCDPGDCGCFEYDRSLVEVLDARGQVLSKRELWSAYSLLTIVPVDVVGGPGDELIIVRVPGRAAPPLGHELKIWRLDGPAPMDLTTGSIMVARNLATSPVACARWRTRLSIDLASPKPRVISMRNELGSRGCCQILSADNRPSVDELRQDRRLRFDPARGAFALFLVQPR